MKLSPLANAVRNLPDEDLLALFDAELVRGLPDDALVNALTVSLARLKTAPAVAAPPHRVTRRKAKRAPPVEGGSVGESAEKVLIALRGEDEPLSPGEIIEKTGLSAPSVRGALVTLRERGLVEHNGGKTVNSRWSLKL